MTHIISEDSETAKIYTPLNSDSQSNTKNLNHVLYFSMVMLILLSSFSCTSYLISQIYNQLGYSNFGQICLFINDFLFPLSTLFVPTVRRYLSFRASFLIPSLGIMLFILGGLLLVSCSDADLEIPNRSFLCSEWTIYITNLLFSMISGSITTLLYATGNEYVGWASNEQNKGFFYGISWAFAQSSIAVGNFSAALLIRYFGQFQFYLVMSCTAFISFILFFFVHELEIPKPSQKMVSLKKELKNFYDFLIQKRIRPLLYYMFASGMTVGFYSGFIYILIQNSLPTDTNEQINEKTGFVLGTQGILELITGLVFGSFVDKYSKKKIAYLSNILLLGYLIIGVIFDIEKNYYISFGLAFVLGIGDCISQMLITCYLSIDFDNRMEGFSTFNFIQSLGEAFGVLLGIFIGDEIPLVFLGFYIIYMLFLNFKISQFDFSIKK